MTIASATKTAGFKGVDGILGIGPVFLTLGSDSTQGLLPTITDNLFAQGHIPANEIGIFFKPAQSSGGAGELTWGGVDKTQVTGSVNYVPITPTNPASNYWGIDQSLTYGNTTIFEKASGRPLRVLSCSLAQYLGLIQASSILAQPSSCSPPTIS